MSRPHISLRDVGITPRSVTRRDALRFFLAAGVTAALYPTIADAAVTQSQIDAKKLDADQAQAELDAISDQVASLAETLSKTQGQIVDVQGQIDAKQADIETTQSNIDQTQGQIDDTQSQIEAKQAQLGDRMSSAYKSGGQSTLDLLLSSASFEELTSNIYYLDKISAADKSIIDDVKSLKASLEDQKSQLETQKSTLESQKADLETQKSDLQDLQKTQQEQLSAVQAKQDEASDLVDNLNSEVQALIKQRDAELEAARQAAEEARKAAAAAAAAKKNNASSGGSSSGGSSSGGSSSGSVVITGSGSLAAMQSAAYSTPSPGSGLCAAWVSNVFRNAGIGSFHGNANDMYFSWCGYSTANIQPGMIIAVNTAPYSAAARIYGHVGIYMGNGVVRDNASGVLRTSSLQGWISEYNVTSTVLCGWLGGVKLS